MLIGEEAIKIMKKGLSKVSYAVAPTLGPAARTVALKRNGQTIVVNDGVTIARTIWSDDPCEQMAIDLILQAAENIQTKSGDGTTTATILANSIVQYTKDFDVLNFKEDLEEDLEMVCEFLQGKAKPCDESNIEDVATIAANNDSELGKLISDVFDAVGHDGVITVDKSDTDKTSFELTQGMQMDKGYISHLMINEDSTGECILHNPLVLLTDKDLKKFEDILPALNIADSNQRPLLIICNEMEGTALTNVLMNLVQKRINCCVVRAPDWGQPQIELLRDMAAICDATPYISALDMDLRNIQYVELGTLEKVVVGRFETILVGSPVDEEKYEARQGDLEAMFAQAENDWERDKIRTRLGRLTGSCANIKVGGMTEMEIIERKERLDDALNSSKAAYRDGIIAGGGFMLRLAAKELCFKNIAFKNALLVPMKVIMKNAGQVGTRASPLVGFDAKAKKFIDVFENMEHGIIDPVSVVINSLKVAVSIANLILSTEVIVPERDMNGRL